MKGILGNWDFTRKLVFYLHYVCAKIHPNRTNFRVKRLASKKGETKGSNFTSWATYSASNDKISGQRKHKKLNLCMYLISYFHYVCDKLHPDPTFLRVKGLARQILVNPKSKKSRAARPSLLPIPKSWVMENVGSWNFTFSLVTYLHYVCAKFHPNRKTFSVKELARRKVAETQSKNFMRCLTYSASNQKILSQGECRTLRLCM